jgi:hypothetical protein
MKPWAALLFLAVSSAASAQDERVGVRLREWFAGLDGEVEADGDVLQGSQIDLDSTLGLDDTELTHEIQLYVNVPVLGRFYGGYWWIDFKEDETLEQTVTFDDRVYAASTTVESELQLDVLYASYEFILASPALEELAKAEIGILAGARLIMADASIESLSASASEEGTAPLPVVGAHAAIQATPWLRGDLEVMGMTFSVSDVSVTYIEAYVEVVAQPWMGFFVGPGYKFVSARIEDESGSTDFEIEFDIDGLYLTAGYRF